MTLHNVEIQSVRAINQHQHNLFAQVKPNIPWKNSQCQQLAGQDSKAQLLEACIDDERQFKTAKHPQAPGDATVRKRFFSAITSLFFVVDRKE